MEEEDTPDDPWIIFSLNRSSVRRAVLQELAERGAAYPSLIARRAGLDVSAVLGAIKGSGERYALDRSLKALGLVELAPPRAAEGRSRPPIYRITERGRTMHLTVSRHSRTP